MKLPPSDRSQMTAAIQNGDMALLQQVLSETNPLASDVVLAARHGRLDILEKLLPATTPTEDLSLALCEAAHCGHASVVRALIPHARPHVNNSAALYLAARKGHTAIVEMLLPHSNPLAENQRAHRIATQKGHTDCAYKIAMAIVTGADPSALPPAPTAPKPASKRKTRSGL